MHDTFVYATYAPGHAALLPHFPFIIPLPRNLRSVMYKAERSAPSVAQSLSFSSCTHSCSQTNMACLAPARSYSAEQWEEKRPLITQLYRNEARKLHDIRITLALEHEFRPTSGDPCNAFTSLS